jgi:myosin heavy subunit
MSNSQDDLVLGRDLTDSSLTEQLRQRHAERRVYTYCGCAAKSAAAAHAPHIHTCDTTCCSRACRPRVVLSVNPYDWDVSLPLYGADASAAYRAAPEGDLCGGRRSLPPHLYAVAEQALRRRVSPGRAQSLLVGGESGAGKTEAVKILLRYMCDAPTAGAASGGMPVVERLVEMNPLL